MNEDPMLKVWLMGYDKLKAKQIQRIGFRDNLLYTTFGIFGAIVSFAVSNTANAYALLVTPVMAKQRKAPHSLMGYGNLPYPSQSLIWI